MNQCHEYEFSYEKHESINYMQVQLNILYCSICLR